MLRLILHRIPQMVVIVLGVTFLAYSVMYLLPGDVVSTILGDSYTKEAAAELTAKLNLDQPFLVRYVSWLGDFVTGDVGTSLVPPYQSIWGLLARSLVPTVEMLVLGQLIALALAILLAVVSVSSRSRIVDRVIQAIAMVCSSLPGFVLALLLLIVFSVQIGIVSPRGWVSPFTDGWGPNLVHILFPSIVLGLFGFPMLMRVFRSELVAQLDHEDYVTLGRLKGISGGRLIFRHVLRNSSFGLLTVIGINVARLIGGIVVVEQIFAIPGMGSLIKDAVVSHDTPTALAALAVVAIFVVVINLVVDILYAVVDPRVTAGAA